MDAKPLQHVHHVLGGHVAGGALGVGAPPQARDCGAGECAVWDTHASTPTRPAIHAHAHSPEESTTATPICSAARMFASACP